MLKDVLKLFSKVMDRPQTVHHGEAQGSRSRLLIMLQVEEVADTLGGILARIAPVLDHRNVTLMNLSVGQEILRIRSWALMISSQAFR